jgi:hypothetical protein
LTKYRRYGIIDEKDKGQKNVHIHSFSNKRSKALGISDSRKYGIRPSIFAPIVTWDRLRPQAVPGGGSDTPDCNVVAVQLEDPTQLNVMRQRLRQRGIASRP